MTKKEAVAKTASQSVEKPIVITRRALQITLLLPDVVIPLSEIPFGVSDTGILYLWDWARVPLSFPANRVRYTFLKGE